VRNIHAMLHRAPKDAANIAITMDVYSHVIPGMDAQAANAVASLILDGSSSSERPGPKPGPSTDK